MKRTVIAKTLILILIVFCSSAVASPDSALLSAAQKKVPAFLGDLAAIVNLDSGSDDAKGLSAVEPFLARRLKDVGASVEIVAAPPAAGTMIVGTLKGKGTVDLMLMIHYDTVFGAGEAARRPFRISGNRAYGPGVADAKGGALIILYALGLARERGFDRYNTLTVLFNPDEEISSPGSRDMIRAIASKQDYVLIYEPPEGDRVTVATNGIAYVHLDVTGLASHAGLAPEKGRNAAVELAGQIMQLRDLGNTEKGTTVNWTVLQAGNKVNVIPDKARATADMRMSDVAEMARVQRDAEQVIRRRVIPESDVSVRVELRRPPFSRNPSSDRLAALSSRIYGELGKTIEPVAMRYGTDAGFAWNPQSARPAVLDGMGIVGDRIHSPDEWADLDSIVPRMYLTVRMLEILGER